MDVYETLRLVKEKLTRKGFNVELKTTGVRASIDEKESTLRYFLLIEETLALHITTGAGFWFTGVNEDKSVLKRISWKTSNYKLNCYIHWVLNPLKAMKKGVEIEGRVYELTSKGSSGAGVEVLTRNGGFIDSYDIRSNGFILTGLNGTGGLLKSEAEAIKKLTGWDTPTDFILN